MNTSSKVAIVAAANSQTRRALQLQVAIDLICPWCFIGKRSLDQATVRLAEKGVDVEVEWLPYLLNPDLPEAGMDRREFRTRRFGWDTALAMDARAVEAGLRVGASFAYSKQTRTSNTLLAHALVSVSREEGGAPVQERLVDALFAAYFEQGRDIGDRAELARIAADVGMRERAVERALPRRETVRERVGAISTSGMNGVPSYFIADRLLSSGSQSPEGYVKLLTRLADAAQAGGFV